MISLGSTLRPGDLGTKCQRNRQDLGNHELGTQIKGPDKSGAELRGRLSNEHITLIRQELSTDPVALCKLPC